MTKFDASLIYNNLILSYIIFTFNKLDFFPLLEKGIEFSALATISKSNRNRLRVILSVAETMGILEKKNNEYILTELGKDVKKQRGFFTWAIGGYSQLLESMDVFLVAPSTESLSYIKGDYVAIGADECNQELMRPIFNRVIDEVIESESVGLVADLGCGNAGRLIDLLHRRPELKGIGIDIDPQAIEIAQNNRERAKLTARLDIVCENVLLLKGSPVFEQVELVTSFLMLHDLFNAQKPNEDELFKKIRTAFPNVKRYVFADTCLAEEEYTVENIPIFTMGYELVHAFRGIEIFPINYYKEQFRRANLTLLEQVELGVPNTYLFVLDV